MEKLKIEYMRRPLYKAIQIRNNTLEKKINMLHFSYG